MNDLTYEETVRLVKLQPFDRGLVVDCVRYDWGIALRLYTDNFHNANITKRQIWLEQLVDLKEYVGSRGMRMEFEIQ